MFFDLVLTTMCIILAAVCRGLSARISELEVMNKHLGDTLRALDPK